MKHLNDFETEQVFGGSDESSSGSLIDAAADGISYAVESIVDGIKAIGAAAHDAGLCIWDEGHDES